MDPGEILSNSKTSHDSLCVDDPLFQEEHVFMTIKLQKLVKELDKGDERIRLDILISLVQRYSFERSELEPFIRFGTRTYQRNLIFRCTAFEVLLLCWENGQRSPIHDHFGSSCAMKIIAGRATESRFEPGENGLIYPTGSIDHEEGTLSGSQDDDIHQVSNLQSGGKQLITMHIYSPPLRNMNVYYLHEGPLPQSHETVSLLTSGAGI